ncbi:NACHT domain- and WD repeat-containing protein 1 [Nematostella vectensis]|uniref:NACHT domain- and WD repeat-containing protein 1 n=1 Tax=Nematostella vectensis TaxID=45351 RepID=UPI002076F0F5|nr:NACHT domain- and WD repeat-containing protein 1 [Nematostella vectensis]
MGCGASIKATSQLVDVRPVTNQSCRTIDIPVSSDGEDEGESFPTRDLPSSRALDQESLMEHRQDMSQELGPPMSEVMQRAVFGDLSVQFAEDVKIVRIFTSSTFTDTSVERNALMSRVYPRLQSFCRERGYDFQVVDLRWGIREEAVDDHILTELCMKEIKECQKLSTGPNFITFLGQKYGYRPLPHKIDSREFEKLLSVITSAEDLDLVKYWYWRDDNNVPPEYILQPISSRLPHFRDAEHAQLRRDASDKWWAAYERIHGILRVAADKALSESAARKYHMSVTEEEVRAGVLESTHPDKQCFWFKRVINDLRENSTKPKAPLYIDQNRMDQAIDEVAQNLLEVLKQDEIATRLPRDNVITYNVHWSDEGIDPESCEEHQNYIKELCDHFYDTLKGSIQDAIAEKEKTIERDSLAKELFDQGTFCQKKCKTFQGRKQFLGSIRERIQNPRRIVVIHGESGCGKTSIMAKVAMVMRSWMTSSLEASDPESCAVVYRFLGTSPDSSSTRLLLHSICSQLCRIAGVTLARVPEDLKSLSEYLPECLARASRQHKIVLVLDSLDQLTGDTFGQELDWWPKQLPDNVFAVLSTLPGEEYRCLPYLKALLPETCFMEVPVLSFHEADVILEGWLQEAGRCLQPHQKSAVLEAFKSCQLPLYLKLAFDEAIRWRSYTDKSETIVKKDVKGIINALFDRLERLHGRVLVSKVFGYITASRSGLTQPELDDLLSLDDTVLDDIYQFWTPPIRRMIPLLWFRLHADVQDYLIERGADGIPVVYWYHRQFIETAVERYLKEDEVLRFHANMAEFFSGKWSDGKKKPHKTREGTTVAKDRLIAKQPLMFDENPVKPVFNRRKLNELPFHLVRSKNVEELKLQSLCDFDFLATKIRATSLDDVIEDVSMATSVFTNDKELLLIEQFLHLSSMALRHDGNQFAAQVLGRLSHVTSQSNKYPFLVKLASKASQASLSDVPTFVSSQKCLTCPGGVLMSSTVVNDQNAYCAFSCDRETVFVCSASKLGLDIQILAAATGKIVGRVSLRLPEDERAFRWMLRASELKDGHLLVGGAQHLMLVDTQIKQIIRRFKVLSQPMLNVVYPFSFLDDEKLVAAMGDTGVKIFSTETQELVRELPLPDIGVETLKALDAKDDIIVYSAHEEGFHLLNAKNGEESTVFKLDERVKEIRISAQREVVVLTAKTKNLHIFDLSSQHLLRVVECYDAYFGLNRLHITMDGLKAVSFIDKEIIITHLCRNEVKKIPKHSLFQENIDCTNVYSDDGNKLYAICHDKVLRIYNLAKVESYGSSQNSDDSVIGSSYPSNDDCYLATKAIMNGQKELQMWYVSDGVPKMVRCLRYSCGLNELRMCSPTRGVLKVFNEHNQTFLFGVIDLRAGKIERFLPGDAGVLWAIGFFDQHHFVAFSREKGFIKIWNIEKGRVSHKYNIGKKRPISEAIMSKNGAVIICALLAVDSKKRRSLPLVSFYCKSGKNRVLKIKGEELKLQGASISREGEVLVALTKDGTPTVWSIPDGKLKLLLETDDVRVTNVSRRCDVIITCKGAHDCRLQMWSMDSGSLLAVFDTPPTHKILMQPSEKLAYTFHRNTFDAWDLVNGERIASMTLDWEPTPLHVHALGGVLVFPVPKTPLLISLGIKSEEKTRIGNAYEGVPLQKELVFNACSH